MKFFLIIFFIIMVTFSGSTQQRQGLVAISNGQIYYEENGSGPPLIFLHGVCLDHRMWQQQIAYFSKSYTCINLDLRGFGKSSVPDSTPYSFHEDIKTLLDSLKIKTPVTLIALSMGGKAAINFGLAYPRKTKALILADAAVDGYSFRDFKLERIARIAEQKGTDSANQDFLDEPIFFSARSDSAIFARVQQMVISYSGWQWIHKNPIHGVNPPAIEQLGQIKVPVLIITGAKDIWDFQQIADILHKNIKQSLKKEIEDAGHMCNMEKPEVFNRLISEFLTTGK